MKRLNDAKALLNAGAGHARGAADLAGYAIECKLKAIAMEAFDCWTLKALAARWKVDEQEVYTHGLEALLGHLPLYNKFKHSSVWRTDFAARVNLWKVSWRYNPDDLSQSEAADFIASVERVYKWLESNRA